MISGIWLHQQDVAEILQRSGVKHANFLYYFLFVYKLIIPLTTQRIKLSGMMWVLCSSAQAFLPSFMLEGGGGGGRTIHLTQKYTSIADNYLLLKESVIYWKVDVDKNKRSHFKEKSPQNWVSNKGGTTVIVIEKSHVNLKS